MEVQRISLLLGKDGTHSVTVDLNNKRHFRRRLTQSRCRIEGFFQLLKCFECIWSLAQRLGPVLRGRDEWRGYDIEVGDETIVKVCK